MGLRAKQGAHRSARPCLGHIILTTDYCDVRRRWVNLASPIASALKAQAAESIWRLKERRLEARFVQGKAGQRADHFGICVPCWWDLDGQARQPNC